jgi:hypothetical protein
VKLQYIEMYNTENVPDHILQEATDLSQELVKVVGPLMDKHGPNIALAALNFLHAATIKNYIVDREDALMHAAKNCAIALVKNCEFLSKLESK